MKLEELKLEEIVGKLKFGIVQGRLTQSPKGIIQCFPKDWEKEFSKAAKLGLDNIELIADREYNIQNPIWSKKGIENLKKLSSQYSIKINTVCNDHIINYSLLNTEVIDQNIELIHIAKKLKCNKYILPLFEKSELNISNYKNFVDHINLIAKACEESKMTLCLETILKGKDLLFVLSKLNSKNIKVVFDTGNRIAFGYKIFDDILILKDKIEHIHLKDKNLENENVILGTGMVNFLEVFRALKKINYKKSFTFETRRGSNPLITCKFNINLINFLYLEAYNEV
jgi:sugar phosphate isomerase/epimerase